MDNDIKQLDSNDLQELEDKLMRIKIMSNGDITNFINFKNNNQLYVIIAILIVMSILFSLIVRKINKSLKNNEGLLGGSSGLSIMNFWNVILYSSLKYVLILFLIVGVLSLRKISLYCVGCSKGSWFYKCTQNSGYGSYVCENYKDAYNKYRLLINKVYDVVDKTKEAVDLIKKSLKMLEDNIRELTDKITLALTVPKFDIPKITNYPSVNVSFNIPYINLNLNVGKPLELAIKAALDMVNSSLNFTQMITNNINKGLNDMIKFIVTYIGTILRNIGAVFNGIVEPIKISIKTIKLLNVEMNKLFDIISNIGIINLILYNILITVNKIASVIIFDNLPRDLIVTNIPDVKLGLFLAITIITFICIVIFPMIGGIYLGISVFI